MSTQFNIIQLLQGSPEWLQYRLAKRNASESAAVLGLSPWTTPYQLWLIKTGRLVQAANAPMLRGIELEPIARAHYELQTGLVMQPLVLESGDYSASLDGMTLEGDLILEIKCPYKGQDSALWHGVAAGTAPEHYMIQLQHQLMVSGADVAHLFVFDGRQGLLLEVRRDETVMQRVRTAWDSFQQYLDSDTPPPLTDADTVVREDSNWSAAARNYSEAKAAVDAADAVLAAAREKLVALAQHPKETGGGVSVTRFWKSGSVDYKRVPELKGVDLDAYRGKMREEVRVTSN